MTSPITRETRLADIVAAKPAAATILDELDVDYCCGGDRSLAEAYGESVEESAALAARLEALEVPGDRDWREASTKELIDFILATHHVYTRKVLGTIDPLLQRVMHAHFRSHSELLLAIHRLFGTLKSELEMHLLKEEELLFPAILSGDASASKLLRGMENEHEEAGKILHEISDRTKGFESPDDACESFNELYRQLEELGTDIHRHVHLENYVLAPRIT